MKDPQIEPLHRVCRHCGPSDDHALMDQKNMLNCVILYVILDGLLLLLILCTILPFIVVD